MMKGLLSQAPNAAPQAGSSMSEAPEVGEEQATPEEQQAYETALAACSQIIHGDDNAHAAVMKMLDPREKIGSLAKAAVTILTQVDSQLNLPETVLAGVLAQVVDWLIELADAARGMAYSEREEEQVLSTATELLLEVYGVDEDEYQGLVGGMGEQQVKGYHDKYQALLSAGDAAPGAAVQEGVQ